VAIEGGIGEYIVAEAMLIEVGMARSLKIYISMFGLDPLLLASFPESGRGLCPIMVSPVVIQMIGRSPERVGGRLQTGRHEVPDTWV
jgi:hypothetical protein